jgi:hypothetical protein
VDHEGERKRTTEDVSKDNEWHRNRGWFVAPDERGGCLLIGQAVSGMEVARAWSGLLHGTWEPVAPSRRSAHWTMGPLRSSPGRTPSSGNCEGLSTDAGHRGGPSRGSDEAW